MTEQIIEHNGKRYRVVEDLGPVRGLLGGELKRFCDCNIGDVVYYPLQIKMFERGHVLCESAIDKKSPQPIFQSNIVVETNIPPRPTFKEMTAGEAAKLHDIVGKWVAVKVGAIDSDHRPLGINGIGWIDEDYEIYLIEGANLP